MKVLAFDFGASSGRAILGTYKNGEVTLTEIHRFPNNPVTIRGRMHWDVLRLFHEIKAGLAKCAAAGHTDISSMGIDTWGVDFGLLDAEGHLTGNPRHYRDLRTAGILGKVEGKLPARRLFSATGNAPAEYNTVYQLASEPLPPNADKLLFMPDLLAYFLTGEKRCERTILSTAGLYDFANERFSPLVLEALGVSESLFAPLIEAGTEIGKLSADIAAEVGLPQIPVVAVAGHDTASAVATVPTKEGVAFISCGTWSILGAVLGAPITTDAAFEAGFTNEACYGGKTRFLRNITGLWIEQQCVERWRKEGQDVSYALLDPETAAAVCHSRIDPNDSAFNNTDNMPQAIAEYCRRTGQAVPQSRGEYLSCVIHSLAEEYGRQVKAMEAITGKEVTTIHMVGGGVKNALLCRATEVATGKKIVVGATEATAMGNVMVQVKMKN